MANAANAINATLYEKLNFNFIRDIAAVAGISRAPLVFAVHPSVPARTVPEFIAYAKANPGKVNLASAGHGSAGHLAGELLKMLSGVELIHVPYRGNAPALADVIAGQVQVIFPSAASSVEFVKTGKIHALATTGAVRSDAMPDLPTVGDFIPGFETSSWYGLAVPKGTPDEIVQTLNREINAGLADAKMSAALANIGGIPIPGSPADFAKLIADETEKWGKVIRAGNIKVN